MIMISVSGVINIFENDKKNIELLYYYTHHHNQSVIKMVKSDCK